MSGALAGRRRWLVYGGVGVAAAAVGAGVAWRQMAPQRAGDRAVDLLYAQKLEGLDGAAYDFARWRGKPMVVNFWATWCQPCVEEMPELSALHDEFSQHVQFVGIGIDNAANMRKFIEKVPVDYPLMLGGNVGTDLARELGNANGGLPFTVVIDAKGSVIKQYLGRIRAETLRGLLAQA